MKPLIILAALVALTGCESTDVVQDVCNRATDGLSLEDTEACVKEARAGRWVVLQEVAQTYREIPRVTP